MRSSPCLQQCSARLLRLTWIVFVMGVMWPFSCCFVECCLQDLFNMARSILVELPSRFLSTHLVRVHVVQPYRSIDTTAEETAFYFFRSGLTSIRPIAYRKLSMPLLVTY